MVFIFLTNVFITSSFIVENTLNPKKKKRIIEWCRLNYGPITSCDVETSQYKSVLRFVPIDVRSYLKIAG